MVLVLSTYSALPVPVRKVAPTESQRRVLGAISPIQSNNQNHTGLRTAREQSATKLASHGRPNSKPASKPTTTSTKLTELSKVSSMGVNRNVPQRTPKTSTSFPKLPAPAPASASKMPHRAQASLVSVVEEQQQSGKLTL